MLCHKKVGALTEPAFHPLVPNTYLETVHFKPTPRLEVKPTSWPDHVATTSDQNLLKAEENILSVSEKQARERVTITLQRK